MLLRVGADRRIFYTYVAILLANACARLGAALLGARVVATTVNGTLDMSAAVLLCALLIGLPIVSFLSDVLGGRLLAHVAEKLRVSGVRGVMARRLPFFLQNEPATLHSRLLHDASEVSSAYVFSIDIYVTAVSSTAVTGIIIGGYSTWLALPTLGAILLCFWLARAWSGVIRRRQSRLSDAWAQLNERLAYSVKKSTALESHVYGDGQRKIDRALDVLSEHSRSLRGRVNVSALASLSVRLMGAFAIVGTVYIGVQLQSRNIVTAEEVVASVLLLMSTMAPIANVSEQVMYTAGARVNLSRLQALGSQPKAARGERPHISDAPVSPRTLTPILEMSRAAYCYQRECDESLEQNNTMTAKTPLFEAADGISDATLVIESGEVVGISGPSGAGKSTLAMLVAGLIEPQVGSVVRDVGKALAFVQTENVAHCGTVREYLEPPRHVEEDEVWDALAVVAMHRSIRGRGLGLDADFSPERGGYSSGEVRRLMIAKALIARPRLAILDEGLSNLQLDLVRSIMAEFRKRHVAVLVLSHNESHLALCDRTVFVESGKVLTSIEVEPVV